MIRKIVQIDEELCDGCGLCVPSCAEGAIQVIDGKARLVSDVYCDGLGACLGECPQGAITIIEREAPDFDEKAAMAHVSKLGRAPEKAPTPAPQAHAAHTGGCPGSLARMLKPQTAVEVTDAVPQASALANWPVQLHLAPLQAPYYQGAKLLIAADCVPFAYPDFHRKLLAGKTVLIGCPKLDDTQTYLQKLTHILANNDIAGIDIAFMEVPCCFGLVQLVKMAIAGSGKEIPLNLTKIGIGGEIKETG